MPQGSVRRPRDPHSPASRRTRQATRNSRNGRPFGTPPGGLARGLRLLDAAPRWLRSRRIPPTALARLAQNEEPGCTGREAGRRGELAGKNTYVVEFRTAAGEALAISIPARRSTGDPVFSGANALRIVRAGCSSGAPMVFP